MRNKDNNKGVEIITKNSFRWWGLLYLILSYGTVITYLVVQYDLLKTTPNKYKITAWGYILIFVALGFLKKVITKFILNFKEKTNFVVKRISLVLGLIVLIIFLVFSRNWINHLIGLLLFIVLGLLISMYPFYKYTHNKERYERLKELQTNTLDKERIESGKLLVK